MSTSLRTKSMFQHLQHRMKFSDRYGNRIGSNHITLLQVTPRTDGAFDVGFQYGPDRHSGAGHSVVSSDDPIPHFTIGMTVFELAARCRAPVGLLREEQPA